MYREDKGKDLGRKNSKETCKMSRDCSISDASDAVEFASEPLDGTDRKKNTDKRDKRNK